MPEWLLLFYVQKTFACAGPVSNGEVDMAWMMVQVSHFLQTSFRTFCYQSDVCYSVVSLL